MLNSTSEKKQFFQSLIRRVMILIGIKVLIISFFFFHFLEKSKLSPQKPQMCYENHCFELEIADTPEKRELWLMFRESLAENQGMLFVFDRSDFWSFWMRNTLIPLDIVRLRGIEWWIPLLQLRVRRCRVRIIFRGLKRSKRSNLTVARWRNWAFKLVRSLRL